MARRRLSLARMTDDQLLDLSFQELALRVEGSWLGRMVRQLYRELDDHNLKFRPHVWLSTEWFSPDGIPGIAIPFYLAHARLMKLEKKQMLDVEGGTESDCMRILRHEAGHAIDSAYRLHHRKSWREHFGKFSKKYPEHYHPKPGSRAFVLHLANWYAQSHPAEDFAETFAVWLTPSSRWRQRYEGWPALKKLEYVDVLMREIKGKGAKNRDRKKFEPLSELKSTLREHYTKKRQYYAKEKPDFLDRDLRRIFSDEKRHKSRPNAASFIRGARSELRRQVAEWTGLYPYTIDQVLQDIIERCRELKLRLAIPESRAKQEMLIMLTVQSMNFVYAGHFRVML